YRPPLAASAGLAALKGQSRSPKRSVSREIAASGSSPSSLGKHPSYSRSIASLRRLVSGGLWRGAAHRASPPTTPAVSASNRAGGDGADCCQSLHSLDLSRQPFGSGDHLT